MQAFRHCLLCSSEGLLNSKSDFLQRTNMAAFRRSVLKSAVRTLGSCRSVRPSRATSVSRSQRFSAGVTGGLCAVPFSQHVEDLTHEALMRRASSLVTDSTNTYLSQTTLALVDCLTQYTKALHTLVSLQKRYLTSLGKLSPAEEDAVWQVIIGQRVEVSDRLDECKRFESNWMNAIHLCELAAEAAENAGASQACATVKSNLQVAQSQVEQVRQLSLQAERMLAEIKAEEIQRIAEYAASMERSLEDVPEAYLRED